MKRLTAKQQIKRIDDARKHLEAAAVALMDVPSATLELLRVRILNDSGFLAWEAAQRQMATEDRDADPDRA